MLVLLLLPPFFMYVFPLFFMWEGPPRTQPYVATFFLVLGAILWLVQTLMISSIARGPKRLKKSHQKVQDHGKDVRAKIQSYRNLGDQGGYPEMELSVTFENLAGNEIDTLVTVIDSKPHEKRYEPGKDIGLKLNQKGFQPAFTIAGAQYETHGRPWAWLWMVFNLAYAIGLFVFTYQRFSQGYGWRFMSPFIPWFWAPIQGIIMIAFFMKLMDPFQDLTIQTDYDFKSRKTKGNIGELILYGRKTKGEIVDFSRTGTYINEQPEIRFDVLYKNEYGDLVETSFKQVIDMIEIHKLKKDSIDLIYLPGKKDMIMAKYRGKGR